MRTSLPAAPAPPAQLYAVTGLCQRPTFRWAPAAGDAITAHLGSAQFDGGDDPFVLVQREADGGAAIALLRVEWEGVFTILASDDELAEALFRDLVAPAAPEEIRREWTADPATLDLYRAWRQTT